MSCAATPGPGRLAVFDTRRAGVLLHPTALGPGGIGGAGRAFIDWLAEAGFSVWQMLPVGPTGADGSPYWSRSDFAGNTALIDALDLADPVADGAALAAYCSAQADWLEDYVLFETLSAQHGARPWWEWPPGLRARIPAALESARARFAAALAERCLLQWQFARQWARLRAHAHARGVRLFGDLPIYVSPDSVAPWAEPAQFQLDAQGRPARLAGVPPDYFAADGQLWGNPLYDWSHAARDQFGFWRRRIARSLERFDLVRLDHFRGLAAYWSVPAGSATAREGEWRVAPGAALLAAIRADCPDLPLVAEDLGVITADVDALRHDFDLPGMRVLQFGFDGSPTNPHLPHNYSRHTVVYTGTHDNDTTLGWHGALDAHARAHVERYLRLRPGDMPEALVQAALASVAELAIVPLQDVLGLGSEARFNVPGTVSGNWRWQVPDAALTASRAARCRALNTLYGRVAGSAA